LKRIRGGSGLGDAIYVRAVADYLIAHGEEVEACSDYPDVFLGSGAVVSPFRRDRIDVLCHYSARKYKTDTNQWQDVCAAAQIPQMPLQMRWTMRNDALIDELREKAKGRPIVLIHGGRMPMGRTDGFGSELMPDRLAFEAAIDGMQDCYLVRIGKGSQTYPLDVHIDMNGNTSVADLFDLAQACDGVIAQCSFAVPLAEVFDKPLLAVWASRGLRGGHPFIRAITPQKIFSKPTSAYLMDNWSETQISAASESFRHVIEERK
jgi:hypothetical protein